MNEKPLVKQAESINLKYPLSLRKKIMTNAFFPSSLMEQKPKT